MSRPPLILATLLGCLALAGCSPPEPAATSPQPVRVAAATAGAAQPPLGASGVLVPRDESRLAFKVGGIIRAIGVNAGETVRAGQVLASLEGTEVEAQVEQARQLAQQAARDLARGEALHADQVIPLEQLEKLRTQARVAAAQLRSAEFNGRHAQLIAPRDGRVLRRLAEPGDLVPQGQVVLIVGGDGAGLAVRASLADRDIARLTLGDRVEVQVDAWPGKVVEGRISEIAGAASERSGLFDVEAQLDGADQGLRPGMVARLNLFPSRDAGELLHVPLGAVLEGHGGTATVYVLQADDMVSRRSVEVAWIGPDSIAVRSGLQAGERVVISGAAYLQDGEAVRVLP
jgi:membrane fusion protein, multidrug efflux system